MTSGTLVRNDIQGLRAIAVLGVIFFHLNKNWLGGGFIGVDIFFVISGYLITNIILQKKHNKNFSFYNFYINRARRIVPAYLALLAVTSLLMAILLIPRDFDTFNDSLKSALYFNSNSFFAAQHDYFAPTAYEQPLLHTWSLAIEMQFYLLLPIILMLTPKRILTPLLATITIILFAYAEFQLQQNLRQTTYFSLSSRIPEFLIGSLAVLISPHREISRRTSNITALAGTTAVLLSFFLITESMSFPGILALPSCIGVALLLTRQKSIVNRLLSCPPLVLLGALSYSLYLWHWPILATMRYIHGSYELDLLSGVAFATLTLGCAYLSYHYIELPFRERSYKRSKLVRAVGFLAASTTAIVVANKINPIIVDPLPVDLTRYAIDAEICHGKIVGDCIRGDKTSKHTLLMLGDSHGAQLNHFADVVGNTTHAKIKVITASSCVTIPGFDTERIIEGARQACTDQIEEGKKYTPDADAIIIAGMWQYHVPSKQFMQKLDDFLEEASSRNQEVLVLAQVPMLSTNPQRIYRANSLGFHFTASLNDQWTSANAEVKKLVSKHKNAHFLDLSSNDFFANVPIENNTLIYQDTHHLNEVGSTRYGGVAAPSIRDFIERAYSLKSTNQNTEPTLSHTY
ncbi:acyltransferase family protein [Pseudomonas putida]|uniref:acyltransferase family protein n=1 Tax=Pseudomonas putida TaxID=303 RepID=UPI00236351C6|nr:acyltransferase family protein [Pseudomonas putida]MDD2101077.1 acyltransferase [Pseudomonas putida]